MARYVFRGAGSSSGEGLGEHIAGFRGLSLRGGTKREFQRLFLIAKANASDHSEDVSKLRRHIRILVDMGKLVTH
jgi:UDP-N-acetylenolpyruvoylglucosamine reductase